MRAAGQFPEGKSRVWQSETRELFFQDGAVKLKVHGINDMLWDDREERIFDLAEISSTIVWMRKDYSPADRDYVRTCQLLQLARVPVLNNPASLIACDEKVMPLEYPDLIPDTTITSSPARIKFLLERRGQLIAKPMGGKAGEGILRLDIEDKNTPSLIDMLTEAGTRKIVLQETLDIARTGDKRIFLLAGEPVGAIARWPGARDNRANMAVGGSTTEATLSDMERQICRRVKPMLLSRGLYLVGLDVIDDKLTEINVTSPTGLEEIARHDESDPAAEIIKWSQTEFFSQQ
jgi:glutathione synthase